MICNELMAHMAGTPACESDCMTWVHYEILCSRSDSSMVNFLNDRSRFVFDLGFPKIGWTQLGIQNYMGKVRQALRCGRVAQVSNV